MSGQHTGPRINDDDFTATLACATRLGCGVRVHTETEAQRIHDAAMAVGTPVPRITITRLRLG